MPTLIEKILPEVQQIELGEPRDKALSFALQSNRIRVLALISVAVTTGLFVAWDKLISSVPQWGNMILLGATWLGILFAIALSRNEIRKRLRMKLVEKGIPVCIPCGYNLTGNKSGTCPECGTPSTTNDSESSSLNNSE